MRTMKLVMEAGPQPGMTYVIQNERITIGRAPSNDFVIDDSRISRYHAQIRLMPGGAVIEDIGSTNGTFINGLLIHESHLLSDGEIIGLADNVSLRFIVEAPARGGGEDMETPVMPLRSSYPPTPSSKRGTPEAPVRDRVSPPPSVAKPRPTPPPPTREAERPISPPHPHVGGAPPPEEGGAPDVVSSSPWSSRWLYVAVGLLIVLIVLFLVLSAYLWFAPVDFWRWLLGLWGFRVP